MKQNFILQIQLLLSSVTVLQLLDFYMGAKFESEAWALAESKLPGEYETSLKDMIASGQRGNLTVSEGVNISYFYRQKSEPQSEVRPSIAILPGYSECWLKYDETMLDLYESGFDVFIMDHRGMGLSTHLADDKQIVHVNHFSDYVDDSEKWLKTLVLPKVRGPVHILAHSTGALIAAHLAPRLGNRITSYGFNAPLIELNTGMIPRKLAEWLLALQHWRGLDGEIAIGRSPYDPKAQDPSQCRTTHSRERCARHLSLLSIHPEILVTAPSNGWVAEILKATSNPLDLAKGMGPAPVLILQAGEDDYVKPENQESFCRAVQHCTLEKFPLGRHELLQESDNIRQNVLQKISEFFRREHP